MLGIELDNVSLTFNVRQYKRLTLKETLVRGMFRKASNPVMTVEALRDIDLKVGEGERLGVLGHNGAGKSTLLKLLAGIYMPTSGRRVVNGRVSSLFDIALGFEHDSNGWENIYNRGYLQGESTRTMKAKVEEIAEFSELGRFLDMPVRYYSAGMMIRLAFSIATAVEPEIIIVDEVLSVGDLAFQQKATARIQAMMQQARLMVIVSHDMGSLARLCTRAVWLNQGRVHMEGEPRDVIANYVGSVHRAAA